MKKIWILFAAIAIVSCKTETPDYAIISGNVSNADVKEMTLYGTTDGILKGTITIAEDGSFNDTIKVAGEYTLWQANNGTPLLLKNGDDIKINFDSKDYKNTLSFTGSGSGINNYLLLKKEKEGELMGEWATVYAKEEADYKKIMYSIKTAQETLLTESQGISDAYKAKEKRNINYWYLNQLRKFKGYHSRFTNKPEYEPSAGFLSDLNNHLDYNNGEDFKSLSSYKELVITHYHRKAAEMDEIEGDRNNTLSMLKVCETIESKTIKNTLAYNAVKNAITSTNNVEGFYAAYKAIGSTNEKNNTDIEEKYNALKNLVKGTPSPKFVDYENYAGGTTSLEDLKGKYVYIDIWATWCGPCKAEIPFLNKLEKQFHGKNIQFVSISVDAKKAYQKWRDMIKEKEMGGIQLLGPRESKFFADYVVGGIPKFILIDPQGNIVQPNAPRPSDKKLVELFKELKI